MKSGLGILLFFVSLMVAFVPFAHSAEKVCAPVALLANSTTSSFRYINICNGTEFDVIVPKGTKKATVLLENFDEEYSCLGPNAYMLFYCGSSSYSIDTSNKLDLGNVVTFESIDGSSFSGPVQLGKTFYMEPLSGSAVAVYINSEVPTMEECHLLVRTDSHVDLLKIDLARTDDDTLFDAGSCASQTEVPSCGDVKACSDLGCDPANDTEYCFKASENTNATAEVRRNYPSGGTVYSSSGSRSSSVSAGATECHWEWKCVPCTGYCSVPEKCTYVEVCKTVPVKASSCTACSGTRVNPPFNLRTGSSSQQQTSSVTPFWAKAFSSKSPFGTSGGSSSSSTSSGSSSSASAISGAKTYECKGSCLSDESSPKFYTSYSDYSVGDSIAALVYVPKYSTNVDVYLAVADPNDTYWIIANSGGTAVAYKYVDGAQIKPYATNLSSSISEWFYISNLIPVVKGKYTLYILVTPSGQDIDNLEDYVLVYYFFNVK